MFGTFLGILLALAVTVLLIWLFLPRSMLAALMPQMPAAAGIPDCSIPNDPATAGAIAPNMTGGVVRGAQLNLPAGTTLSITSDLTLISTGDLKIDGSILNAPSPAAGSDFSMRITLVSLNGNVLIGPAAQIGFDTTTVIAPPAPAAGNAVRAAPGASGGWIKIVAPNGIIGNAGTIIGMPGVGGASASDTRVAGLLAFFDGASAAGGGGGDGGNILLCALDAINNDGWIAAGHGGSGGNASATGGWVSSADATGAPGGKGGSVKLHGLANPGPVAVANTNTIRGGIGGSGGFATAIGGLDGGDAIAAGGAAGVGGTVEFFAVEMANVGTLNAATGGDGGTAGAIGAAGITNNFRGFAGGNGTANGGNGGRDGAMGMIPVPPGNPPGVWAAVLIGVPTPNGTGGTATATSGTGGTGLIGASPSGARSATGGTGKSGVPATPVTAAAAPAGAGVGGAGGTGTSPGTP